MNATDVFLFTLAFLISGLLAGWIRRVSRQRDTLAGHPQDRARDGELYRLGERLTCAVTRIEALERRHEELAQELGNRTGLRTSSHAGPVGVPQGIEPGGHPQPGAGGVWQGPPTQVVEPQSEISESQWRTAMGRLGPAWGSGPGPGGPGRRSAPADRRDLSDGPGQQFGPQPARGGAPLDVLFPPREQSRALPQRWQTDPDGVRPAGADAPHS